MRETMTNELRKLVRSELLNVPDVKEVYFQIADTKAMFPHVVFSFDGINSLSEDNNREDYILIVDVWDKSDSFVKVEDITDSIIKLFRAYNAPQTKILPTFYFESSRNMIDEDKKIKHNQIKFTVQNYER